MQEVIIGFPLSYEVVMRYAELSGFKLYAYVYKRVSKRINFRSMVKYNVDVPKESWGLRYSKINHGDIVDTNKLYGEGYFDEDKISRDEPNLIKVVKEMGEVGGYFTRVVEIPDDVKWHIEENESGHEYIAENYRTWG